MSALEVVFEDDAICVVNKPSGLPSQPRADREGDDLLSLVAARHPGAAVVHRLDQPASGLLIVSLRLDATRALSAMFREHKLERVYRAVLGGEVGDTCWSTPLDGKSARTDVSLVGTASGFSAVELRLHTGRTHQIRRHAALAGHPIAGDRRHGGDLGRAWPRLALHAHRLAFHHPLSHELLTLQAPIPADLTKLWQIAGG